MPEEKKQNVTTNYPGSDTLILLATYNEIDNVPNMVNGLLELLPESHILVVDDNSPDKTGEWVKQYASQDSRVKVIIRTNERGLGSAVIKGLSYAIENHYLYVVNLDADFSHPLKDVPRLLERARQHHNEADVVIGSRYIQGGGTKNWPFKRRVMSRCVNLFARMTLGLKTHDNSGAFRCYRVSVLRRLSFQDFVSTGYSFFEETLFRLKLVNARFVELPIVFVDREKGVSKINKKEAYKAVWIMFKLGITRLHKNK